MTRDTLAAAASHSLEVKHSRTQDRSYYGEYEEKMTAAAKGGIKFWPEEWTRHFRLHCLPKFPLRYFVTARLPPQARIVTFPGGPNPDDVQVGRWNKKVPAHRSRWDHLRATFGDGPRVDKSRWRHLQRYVLPVPWIAEHWRE